MDSCPGGDVSSYYLVRMTQTRQVFLCSVLSRNPDYVIVGNYEVHHLDAGRIQESVQFCRFRNQCSLCPITSLRQFPQHGVEA